MIPRFQNYHSKNSSRCQYPFFFHHREPPNHTRGNDLPTQSQPSSGAAPLGNQSLPRAKKCAFHCLSLKKIKPLAQARDTVTLFYAWSFLFFGLDLSFSELAS